LEPGVGQIEKCCGFGVWRAAVWKVSWIWSPACGSLEGVVSLGSGVRSSKKLTLFLAVGHSPYKEKKR